MWLILKGHYSFGEEIQAWNFNISNNNEVIIQKYSYVLFPYMNKQDVENKLLRTLFDTRKVAGSATYKQCNASLFIQFIQSWKQREFFPQHCILLL